jgi:2,4-dienoyl-CoA reductase-like NADH-dependent reductase (Old Yellow Enzyme family)
LYGAERRALVCGCKGIKPEYFTMPSQLFSPLTLRGQTLKNRVAVSPMSQYRAVQGMANDWHLVHLGRFAMGGAGLVFCEATAVEDRGRRTPGDLGLWEDAQIEGLARICRFVEAEGAVPGIQLAHAGRKASERRPWHGETPVTGEDVQLRSEHPWPAIAPSAIPYADGWPEPSQMSTTDIAEVVSAFGEAAARAAKAGFKVIEVYAAHGFLIHQFYSPIANRRTDAYGGSLENRMRFACEVAHAVRANWPDDLPLVFRLSCTDWLDGGWEAEDTVVLAKQLKECGVDMIDCSTGGIGGRERPRRMQLAQGFQAPFSAQVRRDADMATMAVGFIWDAGAAERMVAEGAADMVALARELLADPNWPLKAQAELDPDQGHGHWPVEFGWWLERRDRLVAKLGLR